MPATNNIDYDTEMVGTIAVTKKDALDLAALTTWFEANVEGYEGPISYTKFKGGQSNPTYRIDTPGTSYVLRRGGTATILGMMPLDCRVGLGAMDLLSGKKLQGAIMGMNRFPVDLPRLVDFYMRGLLDLDTIIAERIPLEAVNEGFDTMRAGHAARTVVVFD